MNRDQIRQLSTLTANAAKSMGMEKGMVGQEIRALLSGKIDKNATIGSALGLGPGGPLHDAYEQAMKTGKGYEFLQDKLKEFDIAGQSYASSLAGTFSQMGDVFDQFSGKAAEGLTKSLEKLSEPLSSLFDQKTGEWDDSLQPILAVFNEIGSNINQYNGKCMVRNKRRIIFNFWNSRYYFWSYWRYSRWNNECIRINKSNRRRINRVAKSHAFS